MALLKGKTAVITGGTTGIGLATAKQFVEEGAYVFISGRRQAELDSAVREIGDNVTGVQGDVSKAEDLDRLYAAVADSGRRLDVVFANAAVIDVARIGEDVAVVNFWSRLSAGEPHPAGPHQVDTVILTVLKRQENIWRICALENVTLTNPRTGEAILRDKR